MAFITPILVYATVALDISIVLGFIAFLARRGQGREAVLWLGKRATLIGFLLALGAIIGSLIYSNVIGYAPCDLCWWQRICLYPQAAIFGVALYMRRRDAFNYALPLAIAAALIALYHTYIQLGGTSSVLPCTAFGGACARVYVLALGYVTIPTMSLSIALAIILLAYIQRSYDTDRHA